MVNFLKILTKYIYYFLFVVVILCILLAAILRFSTTAQTFLAQKLTAKVTEKIGYPIKIGKAKIHWINGLDLENVVIDNTNGDRMIAMEKLQVKFNLDALQDSLNVNIDYVKLGKPNIYLEIDPKTGKQNIEEFINKIQTWLDPNPKKKPKKAKGQVVSIDNAEITDGTFEYFDKKGKLHYQKNRFEESHFVIKNLNASLKNFAAVRDTIMFWANISGYDQKTNLEIKKLKTDFLICKKSMVFNNLYAHLGQTIIKDYLRFDFKSQKALSRFFTEVNLTANLDSTQLHQSDLVKFIPDLAPFKDIWHVTGRVKGTVSNLKLENSLIYFGKKSRLKGDFYFEGLPNIAKTYMDLNFDKTSLLVSDLRPYIGETTTQKISNLGLINLDGSFVGYTQKFKTKGTIISDLGKVTTDLEMSLNKNSDLSSYEGQLQLADFKIGDFLGDSKNLKSITMNGKVKGSGFSDKTADLNVVGNINNLNYMGYNYRNIFVDGKLQTQLFDGSISVKDSNIIANISGIVDLRNNRENFNINGKIQRLNLKKLNLSKDNISLKSDLDLSFAGTNIDNLNGFGRFQNAEIVLDNKKLPVSSLFLYSEIEAKNRSMILDSDLARVKLNGDFTPSIALEDLKTLAYEYKAYFLNVKFERQDYYQKKKIDPNKNYSINYSINLLNSQPIFDFLLPKLYVSKYTPIEGTFSINNTMMLNAFGKADTIRYDNLAFYNSDFDINTSKFVDNPEVLASGVINSEKQQLGTNAPSEKLYVEGAWDFDKIVFNSSLQQQNSTNRADLNGDILFTDLGVDLKFKNSKIKLLNESWVINPQNLMQISSAGIKFESMNIQNKNQVVSFGGDVSSDTTKVTKIDTKNFELATIAPILNIDISGKVTGLANIANILANPTVGGKISIDSLVYNKFWIGDVRGESEWDNYDKLLNINYFIERNGQTMVNLEGIFIPEEKENSLDMVARLNKTELNIAEPFTKGLFSKIKGTATGMVHITGNPKKLLLDGEVDMKSGSFTVDYLNTPILFDRKILFDQNQIVTDNLILTDPEGHKGVLKGGIDYANGFENLILNLKGELNNFKVLNTTIKENDTFYGTAYATGQVNIRGPLDNITIAANATTNKGTKIYIPLDGASGVSKNEDIEYITTDTEKPIEEEKKVVIKKKSNLQMDFNFKITPDAYCELQLDRQAGDAIKAYGNADLNLKVSTLGDFTMNGIYALEKGDYSFNFQTFVTKNFKILPKSKITWTGDPMEANLDIKAEYTQMASLLPISTTSAASNNNSDLNRRYPVSVIMSLKERMLSPTISYTMDVKDYPRGAIESDVLAFKNRMLTNEQELGLQVSSFLLTQSLLGPQDSFKIDNILSNLTEFFNSKVGNKLGNENFQVGLNLADFKSLNENLLNSMAVQFSYNFDDRIRLNTDFSGAKNNGNTANAGVGNNFVGDFSLEWLITKDGHLRLKGYGRNTPSNQAALQASSLTSYGASVVYTKSFNYLFKKPQVTKLPSLSKATSSL